MSTKHSRKPAERRKKDPSAARGNIKAAPGGDSQISLSEDERRRMIAEAAYYRAEQRGFTAGREVDDWLAAEHEISQQLRIDDTGHTRRTITPPSAKLEGAEMRTRPA
jgi:hypothetical protein